MEPLINDDITCDTYRENNRKGKKRKTDDELKAEELYKTRCRIVSLSRHYTRMVDYIRKNRHILSRLDDAGKESMRRTCQRSMETSAVYFNQEDIAFFDSIFGPYIPEEKSRTIPQGVSRTSVVDDTPRNIDEEVMRFTNTVYQTFITWISDPKTCEKLSQRPDLYRRVVKAIDHNRIHNYAPVDNGTYRMYQESDEDVFAHVLECMTKGVVQ